MKMTFKIVVIGGLIVFFAVVTAVVFVPGLIWNPPQTLIAKPYTGIRERGREVFYSNGCNYCHTQYVREEDTAMGRVSEGGDYVFDDPLILGSERTGPNLSYLGRKRNEVWDLEHLKDPRRLSPNSIMPNFNFLSDEDATAVVAYLFDLGDRVAALRMIDPPAVYTGLSDPIPFPTATPVSGDNPQGWPTWTDAELQEGKELYVTYCLTCHGCAGNGLGSYAGTMSVTPADYKQEPFRNMPDDQWFWHVSEGLPGTLMPTWKASLSEDQRWKVIRYIQQIFARPIMRDPDEGDPPAPYSGMTNPLPQTVEVVDQGKAIFIRECMVCHGDAGRGHGPYRAGLQPSPPDFGDGSYGPDYTDADYFWRISEGLPWSAMPSWKLQYGEDDRWALVYYIRTMFTQTEPAPPAPEEGKDFNFPEIYKTQRFPDDVSFDNGRKIFLENCAHCHGLAGDGNGWDGQYLNPTPADFRDMAGKTMTPEAQGEHLAKVTFGIQDTAMPTWGEVLPVEQRWDVIKYLMASFMQGMPVTTSVESNAPVDYLTLSQDNWIAEGHVISMTNGLQLYAQYCLTCHGDKGQGDGPGTQGNASGSPAPFPSEMSEPYVFWRVREGVPDSIMPPFEWVLAESDVWDVTAYLESMMATPQGGE